LGRPVLGLRDHALANCARRGDPIPAPPNFLVPALNPGLRAI